MTAGASSAVATRGPTGTRGHTRTSDVWRTLGIAALVGSAYYAGSWLGLLLRIPPATTSVLWPPNAILTATLLLTPMGWRWALYLAAAFPAHLLAQAQTGWPLSFILILFLTNCSEALIAAFGLRLMRALPVRFETLRGMSIFILCAVILAPFLSSFPDAAVVGWYRGESFWGVWTTRFFSNSVTELVLVPAVVMLLGSGVSTLVRSRSVRMVEAAVLGVVTGVLTTVVFIGPPVGLLHARGMQPIALLVIPLLWAAMRFGPAGASLCVMAVVTVALWAAIHGLGLFAAGGQGDGARLFQGITWMVGVPLLGLAASLSERDRNEELLTDRLQFESLLSEFSGALVHLSSDEMGAAFDAWLAALGDSLAMDGVLVLRPRDDGALVVTHAWTSDRMDAPSRAACAPGSASPSSWTRARLDVPLVGAGRGLGVMTFLRGAQEPQWSDVLTHRLVLIADVMASVLARKETEDALRASEAMKSAILASLPTGVAVLDEAGRIVSVSDGWTRCEEYAAPVEAEVQVGEDYLETCRRAAASGSAAAREILSGVEAVLAGAHPRFASEFVVSDRSQSRWFAVSATPLSGPRPGAVVCQTDVTARRRAESEAQASRQELAHFLRVSTVGVMTTSLAHELNQPLTAILANAQTAQQLLKSATPDMTELKEIVDDVAEQANRAGDVIGRLRDLLRKGDTHRVSLDVAELARDVVRIVGSDALIRRVAVLSHLDPDVPRVTGDRTQIQQVVLNLLLNAIEAAAASGDDGTRTVDVRVLGVQEAGSGVEVLVSDSGSGLRPGFEDVIFAPFYTTKSGGMGMGLSIARSIITAHGGRIWARNGAAGGAEFRVFLPAGAA